MELVNKHENHFIFTKDELLDYTRFVCNLQKVEDYHQVATILVTDENGIIIESDKPLIDKSDSALDYLYNSEIILDTSKTRSYKWDLDEIIKEA